MWFTREKDIPTASSNPKFKQGFSGEAVNGAVNEISDGMGGVLGLMRGVLGERVRTGDESMTFAVIYVILVAIAVGCISFFNVKRRKTK